MRIRLGNDALESTGDLKSCSGGKVYLHNDKIVNDIVIDMKMIAFNKLLN